MRHPFTPCRTHRARAVAWLVAAPLLLAAPAWAHNPDLSKPYTYTVGDAIAGRMQGIFRIVAGLESSTLVYYDRDARNVVAEIVGSADDVEGAKREIQAFVQAIHDGVIGFAKKQLHVSLTDKDVTLVYYSSGDEDGPVEIVRRENGTFVVPKSERGGSEGK
jgi:hypothetical protein